MLYENAQAEPITATFKIKKYTFRRIEASIGLFMALCTFVSWAGNTSVTE